jgi:hypothetical protein
MTKKLMKGGSSCGAPVEKKMTGGSKKKSKGSKKSSKKSSKSKKLKSTEAYCMKCRKHVTMENAAPYEVKNSKRPMKMMKGKCSVCGGNVFKIVGN